MSGAAGDARALVRFAALRRARRKARRAQVQLKLPFREEAEAAMLPALVESARTRLPARAGPFHKGTLTLNALSALAESSPALTGRLVERYRRLEELRRRLGGELSQRPKSR